MGVKWQGWGSHVATCWRDVAGMLELCAMDAGVMWQPCGSYVARDSSLLLRGRDVGGSRDRVRGWGGVGQGGVTHTDLQWNSL